MLLWCIHTSLASPPVREPISGSVWPDHPFGEGRGREEKEMRGEERQRMVNNKWENRKKM